MFLWMFLISGIVRGQKGTESAPASGTTGESAEARPSKSSGDRGEDVQTLTVTFKNGTEGVDTVEGLSTGIVVDQRHLASRKNQKRNQSSISETLSRYGQTFSIGENNRATVDLSSLSVPNPVIFVMYKQGIYTKRLRGKKNLDVTMTVYEPTQNKEVLSVRGHHIPIQNKKGRLFVQEIIMLQNTGNRTFVGPASARSFSIQLPDGAQNVRVAEQIGQKEGHSRSTDSEGRLWFSSTIAPGQTVRKQIMYELPIRGKEMTFSRTIGYKTDSFFIAIPERIVRDVTSNLTVQRDTDSPSGRGKVAKITGSKLKPGKTVSATFEFVGSSPSAVGEATSSQETSGMTGQASIFLLIGIGVIAGLSFVISLSTLIYVYNAVDMIEEPVTDAGDGAGDSELREMLLEEIARLDNDLEAGEINEEYHQKRRSRLKSRLLELEGERS